jgi:Xaa-Pro aminopeptidase
MSATAERRDRLRRLVGPAGCDAALITRLVNVRYLTGFTGSNAALLVTPDTAVLATDGRYTTQAGEQAPDLELMIDRKCALALTTRAVTDGVRTLGFEAHDVTVELHEALVEAAGALQLRPVGRPVERLRMVKDDEEIELLRRACAISDEALAAVLPAIRPGVTERAIGRDLDARMLDLGAAGLAFETIVAGGPHSAIPHHRPTDRRVEAGEFLKIDFGALYGGYHADMTRTFVVGAQPQPWQTELYGLVKTAQQAGRDALAPGVPVKDVDAAARGIIKSAGHGEHFPHGLGHGVGLEIHEAPLMGYDATAILEDRMPVTVEPGVYLPGRGGVRIEDPLVVRETGGPELLTNTPRELLVLG